MARPTHRPDHPVLLFDGVCNLCNALVVFIIRRDRKGVFRFAPLQSEVGASLLRAAGTSRESLPDSIVLVESGRVHARSSAALRMASRLPFPWRLLQAISVVPRPLRDAIYDFTARRRYRWFGKRDACVVPTPELESRFLT